MDIEQLKFFVKACEKGSLSKAAEELYTSQPNVSKRVRELETELGEDLLIRNRKGVIPTNYGRMILEHAKMILDTAENIADLALPKLSDTLKISSYSSNLISRIIVDYYKETGGDVLITHKAGSTEDVAADVESGISELGIVFMDEKRVNTFRRIISSKGMFYETLAKEGLCVCAGPESPVYDYESITFEELKKLRFMKEVKDFYSVENYIDNISGGKVRNKELNYVIKTNSEHLKMNTLMYTDICCLSVLVARTDYGQHNIRTIPVKDCESVMEIGYIAKKIAPVSASGRWVLRQLKKEL